LNQTYNNIELIIIDDGSTDNSTDIITSKYSSEKVKLVKKENAGQLSTFNESLKYITGDIVFLLDSDDRYKKTYVKEMVDIYITRKVNFIFCEIEKFFNNGTVEVKRSKKYLCDSEVGFSVISALYSKEWIGSPTSAISMRREIYEKILPIPFEKDWISRADDCLVYGASILGVNKYYCSKPLVEYRVHGNNGYYNKKFSKNDNFIREITINRLLEYFLKKSQLNKNLVNLVELEYLTRDYKNIRILKFYLKAIDKLNCRFYLRNKIKLKLIGLFIKVNISRKK